ncbi:LOW QUALITY PROTEIN: hypothetical protein HID58_032847 [Brassica napus]|uniref:Uncharacterized protein n=1 Tax=Brassica napus TaxID=3708 RepID=A0ABQ8BXH4_BRANA|nr:LOW QUALITY PROTEIN: hypothetical protein HID58_032847 [Brassica napus]
MCNCDGVTKAVHDRVRIIPAVTFRLHRGSDKLAKLSLRGGVLWLFSFRWSIFRSPENELKIRIRRGYFQSPSVYQKKVSMLILSQKGQSLLIWVSVLQKVSLVNLRKSARTYRGRLVGERTDEELRKEKRDIENTVLLWVLWYRRNIKDVQKKVVGKMITAEAINRLREKGERHAARVSKRERQHFGVLSERWRLWPNSKWALRSAARFFDNLQREGARLEITRLKCDGVTKAVHDRVRIIPAVTFRLHRGSDKLAKLSLTAEIVRKPIKLSFHRHSSDKAGKTYQNYRVKVKMGKEMKERSSNTLASQPKPAIILPKTVEQARLTYLERIGLVSDLKHIDLLFLANQASVAFFGEVW